MDSLYDHSENPQPAESNRKVIRTTHPARRGAATAALTAGMAAGGYGIAHAATTSTSSPSSSAASSATSNATGTPQGNPLDGSHAGPNETLLTGDAAAKATAAAKAAVPGGTIIRVETDAN